MLLSKATYSAFRLYIFVSMWELNPQPFALLTQCSTTEPQEHNNFDSYDLTHHRGIISW